MNYKKLYINIINKAKSENRKKGHNIYIMKAIIFYQSPFFHYGKLKNQT